MLKLLAPLLVLFVVAAGVALTDRPPPRADFTFINRGDVNTLDLQRMSFLQDLRVARLLYEGLVQNDIFTPGFDIIPGVAESWEMSEDGTTYTFNLRDDALWSNGEPVLASHFVYSWRRAILPDTAADYAKLFLNIEGSQAFYDWRTERLASFKEGDDAEALWAETLAKFDELVGLETPDERTLVVRLKRPLPYFLDLCAFAVFYPVYPPLVSQYERPDPKTGRLDSQRGWTKPDVLISNGPFVLTEWKFKRSMRMEANEQWWNRESLAIESIEIPSVTDPNMQVLAFRSGAVDWVSDLTPPYRSEIIADKRAFYAEHADEIERLKAEGWDPLEIDRRLPRDERNFVQMWPIFGTYFYNFNCSETLPDGRPNPLRDARVRRAFAMVIDKRTIVEDVRRLGEPVANLLIPPGSIGGYTSPSPMRSVSLAANEAERESIYEEARALLREAGYSDPRQIGAVQILFNKDAGHDLVAQSIAKDWQRALGVEVSLITKEVKIYREDLKQHDYMTARAGWYGDYGDPTTFLDLSKTGDGNNDRNYSNPAFDDLLNRAADELDPERRMALLTEAEALIMHEVPIVPLFYYTTLYQSDPTRFTGITPHPRTNQNLYLVDILGDGKGTDEIKRMPRSDSHGTRSPNAPTAPTPPTTDTAGDAS
ncbi:MAG: peptide ABC transporter substrate-binding protein [Planctomycetota bacterium]